MRGGEDPVMLIMPSDHVLEDGEVLATAYAQAYLAARQGALVTFGITPTAPLSGYGYIQADAPAAMAPARRVRRFVEKPSPEVAQRFIEEGNYYWNSGMFAFQASVFLAEMDRLAPRMLQQVRAAIAAGHGDDALFQLDGPAFEACPSDSMDYAIMERTDSAVVIPLAAPWSDVGAWDAVWGIAPKSVEGNSTTGDVMVEDSRNCLIHSTSRLVASVGLDDIVVIETADAVLVAQVALAGRQAAGGSLQVQHRSELNHHREVQRPWGSYDSVGQGPRYQVKRITVKPGARLSSQMHHHRAEHWIVVSGTARIYNGDKQYLLTENQSTYIPLGEIHSLENRARSRWKSSRCSPAPIWARTTSSDSGHVWPRLIPFRRPSGVRGWRASACRRRRCSSCAGDDRQPARPGRADVRRLRRQAPAPGRLRHADLPGLRLVQPAARPVGIPVRHRAGRWMKASSRSSRTDRRIS